MCGDCRHAVVRSGWGDYRHGAAYPEVRERNAVPPVLTGTAEELDEQFVGLLKSYAEEHKSLAEQLEATRSILEAAKKDANKKAEKAISKGAQVIEPAVADDEGDDEQSGEPEAAGSQAEENLFA